jgi:hypothetical protein
MEKISELENNSNEAIMYNERNKNVKVNVMDNVGKIFPLP